MRRLYGWLDQDLFRPTYPVDRRQWRRFTVDDCVRLVITTKLLGYGFSLRECADIIAKAGDADTIFISRHAGGIVVHPSCEFLQDRVTVEAARIRASVLWRLASIPELYRPRLLQPLQSPPMPDFSAKAPSP